MFALASLIASSVRGTQSVSGVLDTVVPGEQSCRQNILKGGWQLVLTYIKAIISETYLWSKPPRSCVVIDVLTFGHCSAFETWHVGHCKGLAWKLKVQP